MRQTIVFVLDVSGSMGGPKCETLQLAVQRYIQDESQGSHVGIVLFDEEAWTVHPVVELVDQSIRDNLKKEVPQMARGYTDIGLGVMEGLKALQQAQISLEGAIIFLVTDGEHNAGDDYVDDVLPLLKQAKVIVKCLAIGVEADADLERLAQGTDGLVYTINNVGQDSREMMARVIDAAMQEVQTSTEMAEVVIISVFNDIICLDSSNNRQVIEVPIDVDIGRNTNIQIRSEDIYLLDISVQSPTGQIVTSGLIKDLSLKRCKLSLDQAEPGIWRVQLIKQTAATNKTIRVQVLVDSQPSKGAAIELNIGLRAADGQCPPIIVCRLHKQDVPVVGARLTATVDCPDGTQSNIQLNKYHPNGYYYNYFTNYCGSGRYNVSVLAVSDSFNTKYKNVNVDQFRRQRVADSFQVTNSSLPGVPTDDRVFDELVSNGAFANLHHTDNDVVHIEAVSPIARAAAAAAASNPTRIAIITDDMAAKKQELSLEYVKAIKFIRKSKLLNEHDKQRRLNDLADFDQFLTSKRNPTQTEMDRYRRRLQDARNNI